MLKWNDNYLFGIDHIDEQHRMLFEIGERSYSRLKNDYYSDKYDRIISILDELKEYTLYHFKSEEEYMLKIGYKNLLHKFEHDDFIQTVTT